MLHVRRSFGQKVKKEYRKQDVGKMLQKINLRLAESETMPFSELRGHVQIAEYMKGEGVVVNRGVVANYMKTMLYTRHALRFGLHDLAS